jgi:hypothetical protein
MRGLGRMSKTSTSEPPHPRSLRSLDLSPLGRGEIESRARGASGPSLRIQFASDRRISLFASFYLLFPISFSLFVIPSLTKKREAERRQTRVTNRRILRCGTHPAGRARLSAFHHGFRLREYSSRRLGFRPGFLGLGLHGRYPPSPVPVQGCTSHPGHHAGRLIPKPPGSELQIHSRAPHPLHLSACLRKASFERAG